MTAPNSSSSYQPDRRWHIRYTVKGSVVFDTKERRYAGRTLNLGLGGILFQSDPRPPVEASGVLQFHVDGYDETIAVNSRVIRSDEGGAAAIFLLPNESLVNCIRVLAKAEEKSAVPVAKPSGH